MNWGDKGEAKVKEVLTEDLETVIKKEVIVSKIYLRYERDIL